MFEKDKKLNIYFIGIGGISMSAIAFILQKNGHIVKGSDISENDEVKKLEKYGIKVNIGHEALNITDDIDLVVYSKAIHPDNPEFVEAKRKKIKLMSRSEVLGEIMTWYKDTICVAGTHGKTTTTSIISKVLLDKGINPTINIGGIVDEIGGNCHIGDNKDMFIAEACEYTNSFLDFHPTYEVITNIEADHLDFFKDINDIRYSFKKFIEKLPDNSLLVINNSIDKVSDLYKDKNIKVITYGKTPAADYYYKNLSYDDKNYMTYDIFHKDKLITNIRQKLIGEHNAENAVGAIALLLNIGIEIDDIKRSIENFTGAKRRLEIKGEIDGIKFIDDYAHHPSEIAASIEALKRLRYGKLYIIFQPHTYTRTKALFDDFSRVLAGDFNLILAKIYPARETDDLGISSNNIKENIVSNYENKNNIREYFEKFEEIIEYVSKRAEKGDLIVTMGAGDIYKIFDMYKKHKCN